LGTHCLELSTDICLPLECGVYPFLGLNVENVASVDLIRKISGEVDRAPRQLSLGDTWLQGTEAKASPFQRGQGTVHSQEAMLDT
jgi:hypothetical protein